MINWNFEKRKIEDLKGWEKNPRTITKKALEDLEKSIDELGNFEPLIINIDGTVIAGNQRLKLAVAREEKEVGVYIPDIELSEKEIAKIGIISNRHYGVWDMDILAEEFEDVLEEMGFDDLLPGTINEEYSKKVSSPVYETSEEKPNVSELFDKDFADKLMKEIEASNISEEEKEFLRLASMRHVVFDYSKIADYYSNSSDEVKELMERSALVIIDFQKAIELGYVQLSDGIAKSFIDDYEN